MIKRRSFVGSTLIAAGFAGMGVRAEVPVSIKDTTTPERWYSAEDGGDWSPAFERAQEHASTIILGPKLYEFRRAIVNKSNRTWIGGGDRTVLRNVRDAKIPEVIHCAFMMGNMHPAAFGSDDATGYIMPIMRVDRIGKGDKFVHVLQAAEAANFFPGLPVFVRASGEAQGDGYKFPLNAQFNIVEKIVGARLQLAYACLENIEDACISPVHEAIDPFMSSVYQSPTKWSMVRNVHIRNLAVEASYIASTRTGMFECSIKDVTIKSGKAALAINAAIKCRFERIRALDCTDRILEIKCFSDNSSFVDISGNIVAANPPHNIVIDVGERSKEIILSGIKVRADSRESTSPIFANEGCDNTLSNFDFEILSCPENYTPMYLFSSRLGSTTGSALKSGVLRAPPECARHLQIGGGSGSQPTDFLIDAISFGENTRLGQSIWIAGGGRGGIVSNCRFPYAITTEPGAHSAHETNNSITE